MPKQKHILPVFATASALNDLGADMVKPFWPAFVTGIIGAPASFLGLIEGVGEAFSYGIRFPSGLLADKLKKYKPFVWFGYAAAGLSRIGYALSRTALILLPLKALDRIGKARDPPRDAMLAVEIPKEKRGQAFGILTAADNFGAMLGPLLAFVLFPLLSYRPLFAIAAIPSLISACLILFAIKEQKIKQLGIKRLSLSREIIFLTLISALFGLSWFSISFLILFANQTIAIPFNPILLFTVSACSVLAAWLSGLLSDRVGRKAVYALGFAIWLLLCILVVAIQITLPLALGLFALFGIQYGIITTLQSPFVADLVPRGIRASAIGLLQSAFGFALFAASVIAGLLWDFVSPKAPFVFSAAVAFLSLIFLVAVKFRKT